MEWRRLSTELSCFSLSRSVTGANAACPENPLSDAFGFTAFASFTTCPE